MKLIDHNDMKVLRWNFIQIHLSKRLNRCKNVTACFWPMSIDEQFAEGSITQHCTVCVQTLGQNFAPMCNEQQTRVLHMFAYSPIVERRNQCLSRTGGRNNEIAVT